jgi:hypothetical protein
MPDDEKEFVHELEVEVEAELVLAESSRPEEWLGDNPAQWPYDPTDVERDEVGLRNILGAANALELEDPAAGLGQLD